MPLALAVLFRLQFLSLILSVSYLCIPVLSTLKAVNIPAIMLLGLLLILVAPTQVPSFFDLIHSFLHTCIQLAFIRKALGEQLL